MTSKHSNRIVRDIINKQRELFQNRRESMAAGDLSDRDLMYALPSARSLKPYISWASTDRESEGGWRLSRLNRGTGSATLCAFA